MTLELVNQPDGELRLGDLLLRELSSDKWDQLRGAVAFARWSGVRHIAEPLAAFAKERSVNLSVGVDYFGTSYEALAGLLEVLGEGSDRLCVFHNRHPMRPIFHPKLYLFRSEREALLVAGSGNLTKGGLFTNYEAGICATLYPERDDDRAILDEVDQALATWTDTDSGLAVPLTAVVLDQLLEDGFVLPEKSLEGEEEEPSAGEDGPTGSGDKRSTASLIFGSAAVAKAPMPPKLVQARQAVAAGQARGFLMTLQRTDAGHGQTTEGTARRSPEIFIPLAARYAAPIFWGWPDSFVQDPSKPGKMDRTGVRMRIGGDEHLVNMMTWPDKHDFRLRSEALRSAGRIGDILRIERVADDVEFDYYVEIVPRGTTEYEHRLAQCTVEVRNSPKRFGYY